MAVSPPFNISELLPGDNDIVSQHPFNARAFRDTVESWLLVNHDVNGNHPRVDFPRNASSPSTPPANIETIFVTANGKLAIKHSDGTSEFIGVPPGFVGYTSQAAVPAGWLSADGSAVSRTVFAD